MANIALSKIVGALPVQPDPDTLYFVRVGDGFDLYVGATRLNKSWADLTDKPAVIAAGDDQAAARAELGLGNLATRQTAGTADISNRAVTNAKLAHMAPGTIKGNISAIGAAPSDLSVEQVKGLLAYNASDISGLDDAIAAHTAPVAVLTQAQYDALSPPDPGTVYVVLP